MSCPNCDGTDPECCADPILSRPWVAIWEKNYRKRIKAEANPETKAALEAAGAQFFGLLLGEAIKRGGG